ncbi:hypothetical protein [Streptomyces minutiscleroticus]|uniref:hypothetical protein n=1 Tax=Streptomyces minutiscleroticus TaxID=68238 RepID=UPI0033311FF9
MSAFASNLGLDAIQDAEGHGTEVDVAVHLHKGTVRLSILYTQEILLSADDADLLAQALQRAAEKSRQITAARASSEPTGG